MHHALKFFFPSLAVRNSVWLLILQHVKPRKHFFLHDCVLIHCSQPTANYDLIIAEVMRTNLRAVCFQREHARLINEQACTVVMCDFFSFFI